MFNKNKGEKQIKPHGSIFMNKMKTSIKNQKQYKIFQSKQFLGLILLIVASFLFVVSIVQVKGFSTINSYTIGMLFGYYSYFVYAACIFIGLSWLFQIDVKIEKFIAKKWNKKFHFSLLTYLFFTLGVALIIESIIKICDTKTVFPGGGAFKDFFNDWWYSFTNDNNTIANSSTALPNIYNSGLLVSLFMSLLVSWSGYIVSIIIGLLFITYFVFYILYGSIIKILRTKIIGDPNKKNEIKKDEFEQYNTRIMNLSFEDSSPIVDKPDLELLSNVEAKTTSISFDNTQEAFPIENPLDSIKEEQEEFIESKTNSINLEKNNTTEFDLDTSIDKKTKEIADVSFDFELDIFDTRTTESNEDNDEKEQ